jgi:hypothetical protein
MKQASKNRRRLTNGRRRHIRNMGLVESRANPAVVYEFVMGYDGSPF